MDSLTSGISYIVPKDTGQLSGQEFSTIWTSDYIDENQAYVYVTLSGKRASFNFSGVFNASSGDLESTSGNSTYYLNPGNSGELNSTVTSGQSIKIMQIIGDSGITELMDKGFQKGVYL